MKEPKTSTISVVVTALALIGIIVVSAIMTESRAVMQAIRGGYAGASMAALNGNSTSPQAPSNYINPVESPMPTIMELVGSTDNYECPEGLVLVKDSIDPSFYEKSERKIPKVIHMTSKSRCMTQAFSDNVDKWRFKGHSLFFHDDDAVDRLINRRWIEFPQLQDTLECMVPGAAIADLWRYMMLWVYGGIYTDIDNAPGPWFWNETGSVITNETDALFEQERDGFPSQYFFASSPHHPIMFLAVYDLMRRVMDVQSVQKQYVPFVTGPGAVKQAFVRISLIFASLVYCYILTWHSFWFETDSFCRRRRIPNRRNISRNDDKGSFSYHHWRPQTINEWPLFNQRCKIG